MHFRSRVGVGSHTNPRSLDPCPLLLQNSMTALHFHLPRNCAQHLRPLHHRHRHRPPLFHYPSLSPSFPVTATRAPSTSFPFPIRATYPPVRDEGFMIQFGLRFGSQAFQYASSPLSSPFSSHTSPLTHHAVSHSHILHFSIQYRFLSY